MKITELEQIEFAIQNSELRSQIVRVEVPTLDAARFYIQARYDVGIKEYRQGGVVGLDVWACAGDWRIFLTETTTSDL